MHGEKFEQKPEEREQATIDLSHLTAEELKILVDLAQSGRLRAVPDDGTTDPAPVIEAGPVDAE